ANISQGRNLAISQATGEVIASTDGGVRLDPGWLKHLVRALGDEDVDVASGFFVGEPSSAFESALGATTLPDLSDIDPEKFLPSSRSVAFRRRSWSSVGGYPEWLDYSEDLAFDLRLQEAGYRFKFVPEAMVRFPPRSSLSAFFHQYYLYARGDGKADLWRVRHTVRYGSYLLLAPALLLLGGAIAPLFWGLLLILGLTHLWAPFRRLIPRLSELGPFGRVEAILWVPIIRLTGDLAKMLGYPLGVWWRWRNRPR
ncbi:MAG: glycosyltransferase family 2 protein, partial [Dehalococcoidia bacterium]